MFLSTFRVRSASYFNQRFYRSTGSVISTNVAVRTFTDHGTDRNRVNNKTYCWCFTRSNNMAGLDAYIIYAGKL